MNGVAALFDGERKHNELNVSSTIKKAEEARGLIEALLRTSNVEAASIDGVGISSVVPLHTNLFTTVVNDKLNINPIIINGLLDVGMKIHYENPATLGPDRICSAVAGFKAFGGFFVAPLARHVDGEPDRGDDADRGVDRGDRDERVPHGFHPSGLRRATR